MRVAITGSSGLIGTALSRHLVSLNHEVIAVVRHPPSGNEIGWSVKQNRIDGGALNGIDALVHLAGAGIGDRRWSDSYKRELRQSRLAGTKLIADAIASAENPPSVVLSGSAIGFYGESLTETFDETHQPGEGFLAQLCADWEQAAVPARNTNTRLVTLRTGIVLSADGGALKKQMPLFKLGLGGRMGHGRQWQSWIAIDDVIKAITFLLTSSNDGPVNLTAPNAVTNAEFTDTLGDILGRPTFLPIPRFGPKLLLGSEMAESLLFTGQHVVPAALQQSGFQFLHEDLESALRSILTTA